MTEQPVPVDLPKTYHRRGSRHWRAKLTEATVLEIRTRYATGEVSQHKLSVDFGVSTMTIANVIHRKTWTHLI